MMTMMSRLVEDALPMTMTMMTTTIVRWKQSKEWVEMPGGFSLKKCIEDQVYDATMIQRWMGVRRAIKGIEVMIRDLLQHGEL